MKPLPEATQHSSTIRLFFRLPFVVGLRFAEQSPTALKQAIADPIRSEEGS